MGKEGSLQASMSGFYVYSTSRFSKEENKDIIWVSSLLTIANLPYVRALPILALSDCHK